MNTKFKETVDENGNEVVVIDKLTFSRLEDQVRTFAELFGAIRLVAEAACVSPGTPEICAVAIAADSKVCDLLVDLGFIEE